MKYLLIGTLLFTQLSTALAQDEKVVYVQTGRTSRPSREYKKVDLFNVYKFDMATMITGQYKFGYERRVTDKSSVEIELGATLSEIGFFGDHNMIYDNYGSGSNTISKFGVVTSLAWRYYPLDEVPALNRFYVSPKISFRNYNVGYELNDIYNTGAPADEQKGFRNMTRFMMMMGKQYWLSSTFCLDVYLGLGLGNTSVRSFSVYSQYDYNTNTYTTVKKEYNYNNNSVVFECGLKLGIGN